MQKSVCKTHDLVIPRILFRCTVPANAIWYLGILLNASYKAVFPSEARCSFLIKVCSYLHKFKRMNPFLFLFLCSSPAPTCSRISNEVFSIWKQNENLNIVLVQVMRVQRVSGWWNAELTRSLRPWPGSSRPPAWTRLPIYTRSTRICWGTPGARDRTALPRFHIYCHEKNTNMKMRLDSSSWKLICLTIQANERLILAHDWLHFILGNNWAFALVLFSSLKEEALPKAYYYLHKEFLSL